MKNGYNDREGKGRKKGFFYVIYVFFVVESLRRITHIERIELKG